MSGGIWRNFCVFPFNSSIPRTYSPPLCLGKIEEENDRPGKESTTRYVLNHEHAERTLLSLEKTTVSIRYSCNMDNIHLLSNQLLAPKYQLDK